MKQNGIVMQGIFTLSKNLDTHSCIGIVNKAQKQPKIEASDINNIYHKNILVKFNVDVVTFVEFD